LLLCENPARPSRQKLHAHSALDLEQLVLICKFFNPCSIQLFNEKYYGDCADLETVFVERTTELPVSHTLRAKHKCGRVDVFTTYEESDATPDQISTATHLATFDTLRIALDSKCSPYIDIAKFDDSRYYAVLTVPLSETDSKNDDLLQVNPPSQNRNSKIAEFIWRYKEGDFSSLLSFDLLSTSHFLESCDAVRELIWSYPDFDTVKKLVPDNSTEKDNAKLRQGMAIAEKQLKAEFFPYFYDIELDDCDC